MEDVAGRARSRRAVLGNIPVESLQEGRWEEKEERFALNAAVAVGRRAVVGNIPTEVLQESCQGPDEATELRASGRKEASKAGNVDRQPEGRRGVGTAEESSGNRPETRGRSTSITSTTGGRQIVYEDHHHVHHHHHFHTPGMWEASQPNGLPPASLCRRREQKAEAQVERLRPGRASSAQGDVGGTRGPSKKRPARQAGSHDRAGPSPQSARLSDRGSTSLPSVSKGLATSTATTMPSIGEGRNASSSLGDGASQKLPLEQYFALIAKLPLQGRLQFSPYAVMQSSRP